MKKTGVKINPRRVFSEEFKKTRVAEYERGELTVLELSKLYSASTKSIYNWIYKYSACHKQQVKIVEMAESSTQKLKELQDRIKELERVVGQKQLNIDFLEKMIELAQEDYGIDIKKNSNTPHSGGSGHRSAK